MTAKGFRDLCHPFADSAETYDSPGLAGKLVKFPVHMAERITVRILTGFHVIVIIPQMLQQIQRNYDQIKADAQAIINDEMERIKNDPELCERLGIESVEEEKRKAE